MLLMGKSTISTGPFSIAMLVHQRVNIINHHSSSISQIIFSHPSATCNNFFSGRLVPFMPLYFPSFLNLFDAMEWPGEDTNLFTETDMGFETEPSEPSRGPSRGRWMGCHQSWGEDSVIFFLVAGDWNHGNFGWTFHMN